jgi:hypothetical protein
MTLSLHAKEQAAVRGMDEEFVLHIAKHGKRYAKDPSKRMYGSYVAVVIGDEVRTCYPLEFLPRY